MKKRILALALAGTTAFSVFGAALSANAWDWNNTTDTRYDVDAYQSYNPVATVINATSAKTAGVKYEYYLRTTGTNGTPVADNDESDGTYPSIEAYLTNSSNTTAFNAILTNYDTYTKILVPYGRAGADGKWTTYHSYYVRYDSTAKAYELLDWQGHDQGGDLASLLTATSDADGGVSGASYTLVNGATTNDGKTLTFSSYEQFLDTYKADAGITYYRAHGVANGTLYDNETTDTNSIANINTVATYANQQAYIDGAMIVVTSSFNNAVNANIAVTPNNNVNWDSWTEWTFNGDMTGEVSVEPYAVTTSLGTNGRLNIVKTEVPTIYAYDYLYATATAQSASTIATNWNRDDLNATAGAIVPANDDNGTLTLNAEVGRGRVGVGIRYDVVTDWEDFMEELALNDKFHYSEGWTEFRANYLDMFYSDPVFDRWTGELVDSVDVDLYNIERLLWDIWQLHEKDDYYQANTSQLIYLMQQYDKYIGNYIDKAEVTSDDWGDLLLSILDAATESDFRSASEYRKYQNEVEDLRDAYEMATTVNMIREVEAGMYRLLTSANSKFRAASAPDKATLGGTLEGLFFNVGNVPTEYSVLPSNQSTNVDYYNYNYYVAALNNTFNVGIIITNNNIPDSLGFSNSLSRGYYSLYPALDYLQANNTAMQYPGNGAAGTNYGVSTTDEYEWFLNVYELAANMNALGSGSSGNTKQGSVDAVNDALNAAVADLAVVTSPNSVELGAVEDAMTEYEGKIESDYDEGYYSKYEQAYDYAENIAEGKWQTRIAAMITGVAGEALTYQGTQVTVTKNMMKELEESITAGKTALEAIKNSDDYNAAQVNALNKAIDAAQYIVDLYEGTVTRYDADIQSVNHVATALVGDKDQYVVSDVENAMADIDAAINYSEIVMGWSKNDAGKWQYGTEEGYLNNGWNKIGSVWYYFNEDGTAKQSEWFKENGKWYWLNSNCGAATGWAKVDGEWYFFKGNNAMKTGWEKVDGNWYYMASSGKMVTGWCEVNGKWYYFSKASNSLGQMLYSTTVDGYKLGADGAWIK